MNLIHIHQPTPNRQTEWQASITKMDWQVWNQQNAVVAAFAKAIWLGISAPLAVETVEQLCRQLNGDLETQSLWDAWFDLVRQMNGRVDNIELEAA